MEGERCQANNMRLLLIWIGYSAETVLDQIIWQIVEKGCV